MDKERLIELIEYDTKELIQFYKEQDFSDNNYVENLKMVLNSLERQLFALEVLTDKDESNKIFGNIINKLPDEIWQFLMRQVEKDLYLFMCLGFFFEIDDEE